MLFWNLEAALYKRVKDRFMKAYKSINQVFVTLSGRAQRK